MPKRFPEPPDVAVPGITGGDNIHPPTADSGWPALRQALEAGDQETAAQIAYRLGIPASVIEAMAMAVELARESEAIISRTADAVERLARIRNRIAALRGYTPQSIEAAEQLADRLTELSRDEARAMNDGGVYGSAIGSLAGCWCMFPELFGKPAGAYLGRPTGALEEWVQAHDVDIRARDWWKYLGSSESQHTVKIVAVQSPGIRVAG